MINLSNHGIRTVSQLQRQAQNIWGSDEIRAVRGFVVERIPSNAPINGNNVIARATPIDEAGTDFEWTQVTNAQYAKLKPDDDIGMVALCQEVFSHKYPWHDLPMPEVVFGEASGPFDITFKVRTCCPDKPKLTLTMSNFSTVRDLKLAIQRATGKPVQEMCNSATWGGLNDDYTLEEHDIKTGDMVEVCCMRPGDKCQEITVLIGGE